MRNNRIFLAAVLLVLLLLQLYVNNVFSLMLLVTGIFLPVLSVLLGLRMHRCLRVRMDVPETVDYGNREEAAIRLRLENTSRRSAAAVCGTLCLNNLLTGSSAARRFQSSVSGRSTHTLRFLPEDLEVGRTDVSVEHLYVTDLFHLVAFRLPLPPKDRFVVLPPELPVTVETERSREIRGDSDQFSEQEPGPDPSELFDLRDYAPGDPVRAIHWKQTARQGRPQVREFSKPLTWSAVVLPELTGTDPAAREAEAAYAWNLSLALLEAGVPHTLSWYSGAEGRLLSRNLSSVEDLELAGEAFLSAVPYETPDAALVNLLSSDAAGSGTTLFYLTPTLQSPALPEAAVTLPVHILAFGEPDLPPEEAEGLPVRFLPVRMTGAPALNLYV